MKACFKTKNGFSTLLLIIILCICFAVHNIIQYTPKCTHINIIGDACVCRLGDLLCCETCSAVYHLACVDPPMEQVPEEDWLCSVCRAHQVKGVTDCISEAERSGLLCRQEPIGYDRHARKYWFLCRRIIVWVFRIGETIGHCSKRLFSLE